LWKKGDDAMEITIHDHLVDATNKMSRECKEMIATAFENVGGLEGLCAWIKRSEENRTAFYTRMYIRLLPVNLDIRSHKDVVYHTAADVQDAFGAVGMTLELIEALRKEEQERPRLIEHVTRIKFAQESCLSFLPHPSITSDPLQANLNI
jgi:hypothetical protein